MTITILGVALLAFAVGVFCMGFILVGYINDLESELAMLRADKQ